MENTSYVALSKQAALWRELEVVANNMANVNTPGYKAEEVMFRDYLVKTKSENTPFGRNVAFVQDIGTLRDTREGPLSMTGAPLDIALQGDGFFVIDTPLGQRFARAGHFRLDDNGMIVTTAGYPLLQSNDMPIILAPNESSVEIANDGTVSTENGQIGKIKVVRFENEQELMSAGDGAFVTKAEPIEVATPIMLQGMLEDSNVQAVAEMTKMMTILRNYQHVQMVLEEEQNRQLKAMPVLSSSQKT
ncbi:flagellar basal-body rod protein FlgF [Alphaproteobacteria bacterium]|nr:flagellar basal-body rod protein FlgF [Alphaproteobacteria bacterium]